VDGATAYEVWTGTTNISASATKYGADITGLSTTITSLTNGTTYYVWVKAKNAMGVSDFSPMGSETPVASIAAPQAPAAPTVTASNTQLAVSWTAVDGATAYEVWTGTSNNSALATKYGADITGLSATITSLTNGTTYYVWIKAKNSVGTSGFSPRASGTPLSPPVAPGTPTVTTGNGELTVRWQAVTGASVYEVWLGTTDNSAEATKYGADVSGTSTTITGLNNGTTYYVWVKATKNASTSVFSPSASGTPLAPPLNIRAILQAVENILVSWDEAAGGVSYKVYRSNTSGTYALVGTSSTPSYTDSGLSAGTTYYYKVSTVKGSFESAQSDAVSATTQIGTSIAITLSQNDVNLPSQSVSISRGESRSFQVTGSYAGYQWYLNGSAINGATGASYTLDTASMKLGVYELSVSVTTGVGAKLSGDCRVRIEYVE
jgi:hypothetical protein